MKKISILLVDDESIIRESFSEWLINDGYEVECAADGTEALEKAKTRAFDTALVDLKMPGLNGIEVMKLLKKDSPHTSVIIITAYGTADTEAEAREAGASDYLRKPFTFETLEQSIQDACRKDVTVIEPRKAKEFYSAISKQNFAAMVNNLIKEGKQKIVGVVKKENKYVFDNLTDASELCLDYDITILPPKKYFFPQKEAYLKFHLGNEISVNPIIENQPTVIIGVHPYDIKALQLTNKVFLETYPDPNYLSKKDNSVIIGINCLNPHPNSFAKSMNTNTVDSGFDLLLTDIGTDYLIEIGSEKGKELLQNHAKTKQAGQNELSLKEKTIKKAGEKYKLFMDGGVKALTALLEKSYDHPYWAEIGDKCLSCSSCTTVCPTCVCFDVREDVNMNLKEGERVRNWDSCLVPEFAKVATGENFREHRSARTRHRMLRKGKYIIERFGIQGCVGCGRCITACLPDIANPVEAFKRLRGDK